MSEKQQGKLDNFDRALLAKNAEIERLWKERNALRQRCERLKTALRQLQDDMREYHDTPDTEEVISGLHTNCGWCMAEAALCKEESNG